MARKVDEIFVKVDEMSDRIERIEEDARDLSMVKDEIVEQVEKLEEGLNDLPTMKDGLVILKKVVGQGLFANPVHVKIKRSESLDGAINVKVLGKIV